MEKTKMTETTNQLQIFSSSFQSFHNRTVLYATRAAQLLATNEVKVGFMKTAPSLVSSAGQPSQAFDLKVRIEVRIDG